jgi:uncharacterized membrane-anchored protein
MQLRARDVTVIIGLVLILALVNWQIAAKERVLRDGELMLLELAPVDPRSLMQGDYMRLDYAIARELYAHADWPSDGKIIVANDEHGVARFVRRAEPGAALGAAEHLLRYRRRSGWIRIGTDAFFFQEGTADAYREARFGELRVDADGEGLLVGLRDRDRHPLGVPATASSTVSSPAEQAPPALPR